MAGFGRVIVSMNASYPSAMACREHRFARLCNGLANDGPRAAELMTRRIALLTEGIADFLQFVRASGDSIHFTESG